MHKSRKVFEYECRFPKHRKNAGISTHRPKSAANGVRIGEASNPGPTGGGARRGGKAKRTARSSASKVSSGTRSVKRAKAIKESKQDCLDRVAAVYDAAYDSDEVKSPEKEQVAADYPTKGEATSTSSELRKRKNKDEVRIEIAPDPKKGCCFNCGKRGHKAAECRAAKNSKEPEEPTSGRDKPEKPKKTPEEKYQEQIDELRGKASAMWLTKDPRSAADMRVVKSALSQFARTNRMTGPGLISDLLSINASAVRQAVVCRTEVANGLSYGSPPSDKWGAARTAFRFFQRYLRLQDLGVISGSPVDVMHRVEALEPLSRLRRRHYFSFAAAMVLHALLFPVIEELLKRAGHFWLGASAAHTPAIMHLGVGAAVPPLLIGLPVFGLALAETLLSQPATKMAWLVAFLIRFALHFIMAIFPLVPAVLLHAACNSGILFSHIFLSTSVHYLLNLPSMVLTRRQQLPWGTEYESKCLADLPIKKVGTCDNFVYKPVDPVCKASFGFRSFCRIAGIDVHVHRACSCNEEISITARVGKAVPVAEPSNAAVVLGHWRAVMKTAAMQKVLGLLRPEKVAHMKLRTYLKKYPPARRAVFDKLIEEGYEYTNDASAFIKREAAFSPTGGGVKFKDPRMIQGTHPCKTILLGPAIVPGTKVFKNTFKPTVFSKDEIYGGRNIYYMCGASSEEVGRVLKQAVEFVESELGPGDRLRFLEDDQSRFDLHMREGAFHGAGVVHSRIFDRATARLLRRSNKSKGRTSLGSKYSIDWTMRSGEPDTALTDTIVNALMKWHIHGIGRLWISIIMGDDSITITSEKTIAAMGGCDSIIEQYAKFGMEIEAVVRPDVLSSEMCSSRFYPVGEEWVLFPKPGRLIAKGLVDIKRRTPAKQLEWLLGIATGMEQYGSIDPIIAALARCIRRHVGGGRGLIERSEYKNYNTASTKTNWDDVCKYYDHQYGFAEHDVLQCIAFWDTYTLGTLVTDPRIVRICETDCL